MYLLPMITGIEDTQNKLAFFDKIRKLMIYKNKTITAMDMWNL